MIYCFTLSIYAPFSVSILILSPSLINKGTLIFAPVSVVAGLNVLVAVLPFNPGSVCAISNITFTGSVADKGLPLSASLPTHIILSIKHTEPGVKGNTATNTFKPATTETGASIQVPLFINEGDKIKIDTLKCAYIERVK